MSHSGPTCRLYWLFLNTTHHLRTNVLKSLISLFIHLPISLQYSWYAWGCAWACHHCLWSSHSSRGRRGNVRAECHAVEQGTVVTLSRLLWEEAGSVFVAVLHLYLRSDLCHSGLFYCRSQWGEIVAWYSRMDPGPLWDRGLCDDSGGICWHALSMEIMSTQSPLCVFN